MLLAVGTKDFYYHSVELYGRPASLSSDRRTTNLGLARHFDQVVVGLRAAARRGRSSHHRAPRRRCRCSRPRFDAFFAGRDIRVVVADGHGGGGQRQRRRDQAEARDPRFRRATCSQIEFHEGQVHVATALNGRSQPVMVFLGVPTPRTTSTQEGLAVLTEFLTASTSLPRVRRISDRVLAIQKGRGGRRLPGGLPLLPGARLRRGRRLRRRPPGVPGRAARGRRALHQGRLLPGRPAAGDQLPAHRPDPRAEPPGARAVRRQAGGRGRAAVRPPAAPRAWPASRATCANWANDLSFLTALMGYAAFLGESDLGRRAPPFRRRAARAPRTSETSSVQKRGGRWPPLTDGWCRGWLLAWAAAASSFCSFSLAAIWICTRRLAWRPVGGGVVGHRLLVGVALARQARARDARGSRGSR